MIAILDYEAGNLTSVELAVKHIGAEAVVTQDPQVVKDAERVIFPGVGAAAHCMDNLQRLGLNHALADAVSSGKPVLAICIGIQLLFEHSAEDGGVACMGLLPGDVVRFEFPPQDHVKVPHMGWNAVKICQPHPVLSHIKPEDEFYFVHSYYPQPRDEAITLVRSEYGDIEFTCAVGRDNLVATQFHPEKSGEVGLEVLRNFASWDGVFHSQ